MADNSPDVVQWLLGIFASAIAAITGGSLLHQKKRIDEIPEKYLMKTDFNTAKQEIREDIAGVKTELLGGLSAINSRLDNLDERRRHPR